MLQPDKLKKLNENASLMAAQGKSKEEILAMKDAFIKQFGIEEPLKKKDSSASIEQQEPQAGTMALPSEDGLSVTPLISNKEFSLTQEDLKDIGKKQPTDMSGKPLLPEVNAKLMKSIAERPKPLKKIEKQKSYMENMGTSLISGLNDVNKMIASIPETIYNLASIPQNAIAYVTGLDISTTSDKFKKNVGITNPILDYYKEEGKKLEAETAKFNEQNYKSSSIYQNIEDGNYQDAFELLGTGIVRSAPTSIAIMTGGATMSAAELATVSTAAFYDQNLEQLQGENPDASDIENNIKALGMSAAESVFSSIGQGQIGAVYRDIIRKEGIEVGQKVFKDGLIEMYKGALKKYGVPVGLMGEGIEESATQITQNMISGKPAFEGAADAFILGGGSGVMFTAPMSLKNANDRINNKLKEVEDKKQINLILDGSTDGLNKIFDVAKDSEINEKQLSIASLGKSRELLVKELNRGVKKGEITKDQAKQSLYVFDKTKQITGQLRDIDIDNESKVKVANLLKERESLSQKIQGKDEALSVLEKQRIAEINEEIKQTILNPKETASEYIINEKKYSKEEFLKELEGKTPDELKTMKIVVNNDEQTAKNINEKFKANAIQEQTTDESVLRTEQPEVGLQEMGEGDTQTEIVTDQATQEVTPSETITTEQEEVTPAEVKPIDNVFSEVDSFNKTNRPLEFKSQRDYEFEYDRARDKEYQAKRNIAQADDTDAAIKEYEAIKKEREDLENEKEKEKTYKTITSIIYDTVDDSKKPDYQYKELFDKDPRLAAIEDYKDLTVFLEQDFPEKTESIDRYKNNIKILEEDIKNFPLKENTFLREVTPAETTAETAPVEEKFIIDGKEYTKEKALKIFKDESINVEDLDSNKPLNDAFDKWIEVDNSTDYDSWEGAVKGDKRVAAEKAKNSRAWNKLSKLAKDAGVSPDVFISYKKADNYLKNNETPIAETTAEATPSEEVKAEVAPVEEVKGKLDELLGLDPADKTTLGKISSELGDMINEFKRIEKDLGSNILLVPMRYVLQAIKGFVDAGMTLQEAIKKAAADQNLKVRDVIKGINTVNEIAKIAPAYNALMEKADALIARQKAKGIADKKIISNLDTMIRKSPIYTDPNTTDAQRKIMEREARAKMGVAPKKAVSIGRVIGALNDIRNVSRAEKLKIISRIRELSKDAAKDLVEEIRELAKKGNITTTQAVNIISRFGKVNMLNEASVSNFVDYMTKVFADAEYDNKIKVAKGKLKNARKSIATKIGIANGLVGPLQKLFSINPELIPESYLERYLELVDMFGARQAVLSLEEKSKVTKDVIDILDEINNERSAVDDLSYRLNYSDNKVIEDGKLNYAATVKNMLKEGDITEEEAALMTKYKSEIVPQTEKSSLSEEELQQEKDDLVEEVKKSTINANDLPTRSERDAAKKIAELIKSPAVKELSNAQLKNLLKVIDNINNGYFAHSAQLIIEEINSNNNSKSLKSSLLRAVLLPLSKLYAQAKSILTRKDAVLEMIRRNPLFNIDQVLGDFKTKDVFNSILGKAAEGEAKFTSELKAIQLKLVNAEEKIAKSFKLDANKTLMSKFKMMTYMVQLEYNSNPDSKQVNPAAKFIEATINHINEGKSQFGEKDAEMLQEILDNYTDADGNIDVKELYNSFNSAEKAGIKTIQEVNQSLKEKAEYTASVIRGQRINPLSNYIHLNVLSDTKPNDLASGESFADQYNNSLRPSTKAKSLIERTGKVSPLNFDVFASAQKGAKFVLMDFHLTEPIRTARKTINKTIDALGKVDKDKKRIINAISNSFEESVENLVNNSYMETSVGDDVSNYIKKQGYRSVLAGTGRFVAEFLSNVGFVIISDPTTFAEGLKYTSTLMSPDAPLIMHNVNSKEINRIFPSDTLSGRLVDTNILNEANGIRGGKAKNKVINKAQQIWNLTGKKYKNAVELTADILITTPDKAIMRPIWFGSFATNFKNETGQDVDFEKIATNDEAYMSKNKEAIEKAKDAADERSVITGASNNAFTGILKGTSKPNQSNSIKQFNNFNNFMSRFLIYEYTSARTGIMAAMGNGSLDRRQGIALLGAVTIRMTVYSLLSKALGSGLIGLLFGDDDEEDEKSLDKSIGQALTSTFTSLLFNRDFGNATKMVINNGIEKINENYLQALREGDYDPYKDAIQYTSTPIEKEGKKIGLYDYIEGFSGAYGPAIKTTNLIVKTYREEDKKEADAIQRQEDVKNIRIPLEVLGNAGFIPLYKDIRKELMKEIYKGLDKKTPVLRTVKAGDEFK